MKLRLMTLLILSFWSSANDCQELYIGFGFGAGPAFPVINQTQWRDQRQDPLENKTWKRNQWKGAKMWHGHTSFNLLRAQMGPVVNSEFFVGYEPLELSLHGSFFRMPQRILENIRESHSFDFGGWLNSLLLELRCKISEGLIQTYGIGGLGAFLFRSADHQNEIPTLHFGSAVGIGSRFTFKKRTYFFSEIRFQGIKFRGQREDVAEKITGTLSIIVGCRFWIAVE